MLQHLHIRDFAIVAKLDVEFVAGLTVVTGETGAGKSIAIDALALVLGERADAGVIRQGCKRSEVTAGFAVRPNQAAAAWLRENDLFEDHECVLRRVIEIDKPSKGFINGRPVPIQMLRDLGELLVDIHGQHEHQSLLRRDAQRQILDDFAGLTEPVERLGGHFRTLTSLTERRDTLQRESADREARIELLRYQVRELEALNLAPDEMPQLEEEHARLAHGAQLLDGAQAAAQIIYDDEENATSQQLARAIARLEALSEYDARLGEVAALLNEAAIQVDEAAARLHHYLDGMELDPNRLEWLDRRLGTAHDLARKHRVKPEELPAVRARLATELGDIENFDTNLAKLELDITAERKAYLALAADIGKNRRSAAAKLGAAVSARMQELGMPGGQFEIALTPLTGDELSAHGLERVEFLVSANPGQPPKPLAKVASGGELSRISLALQVVTAAVGRIPTLIFDEVDVGVGGRVAEIVGQQLRALGKSRQVLCITHLAQVAALGEAHLSVAKHTEAGTTLADVKTLDENARVQEIARMIGGIEISKQTLAHAQDMLARATA
jgi:DNA repair protein RecN (Recombination protein N)